MFSSKNLPIMPALCSKLAYYAGIMLDALACLLCLKLCRHNRRMPNRYSFFPRTVPEWNNLPSTIAESDNIHTFKYKLTNY